MGIPSTEVHIFLYRHFTKSSKKQLHFYLNKISRLDSWTLWKMKLKLTMFRHFLRSYCTTSISKTIHLQWVEGTTLMAWWGFSKITPFLIIVGTCDCLFAPLYFFELQLIVKKKIKHMKSFNITDFRHIDVWDQLLMIFSMDEIFSLFYESILERNSAFLRRRLMSFEYSES